MKQLLIIGLLCFATVQVAGQVENVDSLVNVLETQKLTAREQMALYMDICEIYIYNDFEKCIQYAEKALTLAEKEKEKAYISKFNVFIATVHKFNKKYDKAIEYYNKAIEYAQAAGDLHQEAVVYGGLGGLYTVQKKYVIGLEYYLKALSINEKIEDELNNRLINLSNISNLHMHLKNRERALYYLEQAETIAESLLDKIVVYSRFGNVYEEPGKKLEYFQKAYELAHDNGYKDYEASSLLNIAIAYKKMDEVEKSFENVQKALQLGEEAGRKSLVAVANLLLSDIHNSRGNWKEGEIAASKAWENDSTNMDSDNMLYQLLLANINLNNKNNALIYLEKFYEFVKKNRHDDEVYREEFRESIAEMEVKYETEKKEMQIASLEKERQLYLWLGIAGVLLAVALGLVFWQYSRNMRKKRQIIASESIQEGEVGERARIAEDLHDRLGGSLSAVKMGLNNAESLQSISDKIDTCMSELRDIMNNIIPRSLRQYGMKGALEDLCTQYANLQFHFFGDDARIKDNLEYNVYCCARELVNNAQKHAGASTVNLQLVQSRKHVSLTVQDDGCGFDERTVVKGDGLQNIRNRIASCRGKMDVVSAPGKGTETVIELVL